MTTKATDFELQIAENKIVKLSDFAGKNLVLYFYPKDNTPGCTQQAKDFRDHLVEFEKLNTVIIGISKDSLASHQKFKDKYELNFILGSDSQGKICNNYGTWVEKSMFGKKYFGIERSTFLINTKGEIIKHWPKVKVNGHVKEVLKEVEKLN